MRGATAVVQIDFDRIKFQSTRPMRGATQSAAGGRRHETISIHAPHAGRDWWR